MSPEGVLSRSLGVAGVYRSPRARGEDHRPTCYSSELVEPVDASDVGRRAAWWVGVLALTGARRHGSIQWT